MNRRLKIKSLELAILVAFPVSASSLWAAEPYPALPPSLSTGVAPNVMIQFDNSGSMGSLPVGGGKKTKLTLAKEALVGSGSGASFVPGLIDTYPNFRWGLFSFDTDHNQSAGVLVSPIASNNGATVKTAVNKLTASTNTPLAEAFFEVTRYFAGDKSYAGKTANTTKGVYTSPIQYRCQKNFAIVFTDGLSNGDDRLPGLPVNVTTPPTKPPSSPLLATESYTSYDSGGNAVTKSFGVCRYANMPTAVGLSCPTTIEGAKASDAANDFQGTSDSDSTWGRSVRDVAQYAFDKDFRVGGSDGDNISFDDAKFKKQNLITYTIGFAVGTDKSGNALPNPVLNAAAIVGGGKHFLATDGSTLNAAFSSVAADIVASTSNAGGVAIKSEKTPAGNVVLQPIFNPDGWYGDLLCWNIASDGTTFNACSVPNAQIPVAASRKIYTSNVSASGSSYATTPFDFNATTGLAAMTSAQRSALGTTTAAQTNVINFIRGQEGISGFRVRPKDPVTGSPRLLGDIVDAQPAVVSAPAGLTTQQDYAAFSSNNAARNLVFVGANDGMLHGFDVASMQELMGYVPSPVYKSLPALAAADYGQSGGTPHAYFVNGSLRKADVQLGGTTGQWRTLLVGGLGQGGRGYFALDVTDKTSLSTAKTAVKWEWNSTTDADMGYTIGQPTIYLVRVSSTTVVPAVIFSNGYENDFAGTPGLRSATASALYIVNADTGALIRKISLPKGSFGLSAPAAVDSENAGNADYVYAGDLSGRMWRFDLTGNDPASWSVDPTPIFDAGPSHPIVMRPGLMAISSGGKAANLVLFGTGKLLTDNDRLDTTTQSLYGVVDVTESSVSKATLSNMVKQAVDSKTASVGADTYRKMSQNAVDLTSATTSSRGWYIDLPVPTERLVASPIVTDGKVVFGTGITASGEQCLPGGKGWVMALNPLTGSVTKSKSLSTAYSAIDVNNDGKSSAADKVAFSSGAEYPSGFELNGIPTELSYITLGDTGAKATSGTYAGSNSIAITEANGMGVYSKVETSGVGAILTGIIGTKEVVEKSLLGPSSGVKVEASTWRELK